MQKKVVKLKQKIQLSVENDNIDEEQIHVQLYMVKLQHTFQLFVSAMITIHHRAECGIFLNTFGACVFTYTLTTNYYY